MVIFRVIGNLGISRNRQTVKSVKGKHVMSGSDNSQSQWVKWAAVFISLLTVLLNVQIFLSNEKLKKIELLQESQKQALEEQKLLLQKQNDDLHFRLDLFDRAYTSVKDNNARQLKILLTLVQTLPKSDYSDALLNVLADSTDKEIKQQASNELKDRLSSGTEWVYKPSTKETEIYPDYDIFICEPAISNSTTDRLLISILNSFDKSKRIGSIRIKKWDNLSEFSLQELSRKTTVLIDKNHDEKKDAETIINEIVTNVKDLPPVNYQDNRGKRSPWRISIVICP
jgi:hypothetical protein